MQEIRKFKFAILLLLLLTSCGSRKKQMTKQASKTEIENISSGSSRTDISSTKISETNLSQFLEDRSLKITSNGSPYQLQYGSLIFSGSADVELGEKKQEVKYVNRYKDFNVYHRFNIYRTQTAYRTQTTFKSVNVDRAGLSFGSLILIISSSTIGGAVLWELLKKFIPVLIKKIFKKE